MISDGVYHDRYYPGLLDGLDEDDKQNLVYLPTIVKPEKFARTYREFRKMRPRFMVLDDFLHFGDYIRALLYPWRLLRIKIPEATFLGIDVLPLIKSDLRRFAGSYSSLAALLGHYFVPRLKARGVQVRHVVEWYENQVIDRGMISGFKKHYPKAAIIGYQGFVVSPNFYLHHRPTATDHAANVVPDTIAMTGRKLLGPLNEFCGNFSAVTAPAFRFSAIWRKRRFYPDPDHFTILASLPIGRNDIEAIVMVIVAAAAKIDDQKIRFRIKPHPSFSVAAIKAMFSVAWPDSMSFVTGSMNDHLEESDLFVSNASSSCIESLVLGVPVIVVGNRDGISANPIPKDMVPELWRECFDDSEFLDALARYRNMDAKTVAANRELGTAIRADYFEPVTPEGSRKLLGL